MIRLVKPTMHFALRKLSLSGAVGNLIAFIIYGSICLVSAFIYIHLKRIRKLQKIDLALLGLSILFCGIFLYNSASAEYV